MARKKNALILVRAIERGYYVHLREEGDEFEIPSNLFSKNWMQKITRRSRRAAPQPDEVEDVIEDDDDEGVEVADPEILEDVGEED